MSEAFSSCSHCGEVFSDYNEGWTCCRCGRDWCSPECAEEDGYREVNGEQSCNFCRGDDFEDYELLEFVTSAIGVSRDDLVNFYKRYKTELKNDKACRLDGFISSVFTNKDSGTGKGFILGGLVGRFEPFNE